MAIVGNPAKNSGRGPSWSPLKPRGVIALAEIPVSERQKDRPGCQRSRKRRTPSIQTSIPSRSISLTNERSGHV